MRGYNTNRDYYAVLQVASTADQQTIKAAYWQLAKIYHPDGSNPDEWVMRELNEAYEVLGDPAKRSTYDWLRKSPQRIYPPPSSPRPHSQTSRPRPQPPNPPPGTAGQQQAQGWTYAWSNRRTTLFSGMRWLWTQVGLIVSCLLFFGIISVVQPSDFAAYTEPFTIRSLVQEFPPATATSQAETSRSVDVAPRNLDLWAVYPDGRLEFATLFYPGDPADPTQRIQTLTAAGPLILGEDTLINQYVIGGDEANIEVRQGLGKDADLQFQLFTVTRPPSADPYGVDVLTSKSPYLHQTITGVYEIALGNGDAEAYLQAIVALAIPDGSTVEKVPDLVSYRDVRIGGWHVYYFDTTLEADTMAIRMAFTSGSTTPDHLDVKVVDEQR